jgi:hypothetical protein
MDLEIYIHDQLFIKIFADDPCTYPNITFLIPSVFFVFIVHTRTQINPRALAVSDCGDKGSQKALCAADISAPCMH